MQTAANVHTVGNTTLYTILQQAFDEQNLDRVNLLSKHVLNASLYTKYDQL